MNISFDIKERGRIRTLIPGTLFIFKQNDGKDELYMKIAHRDIFGFNISYDMGGSQDLATLSINIRTGFIKLFTVDDVGQIVDGDLTIHEVDHEE